MSLASMTGFARVSGEDASAHWVWEARSVNGKGLDVRVRLPSGWPVTAWPGAPDRARTGPALRSRPPAQPASRSPSDPTYRSIPIRLAPLISSVSWAFEIDAKVTNSGASV